MNARHDRPPRHGSQTGIIDAAGAGAPSTRGAGPRAGAALLSGLLLAASFPPLDWGFLAWVALIPLLWALDGASIRQALARGYAAGLLFMAGVGYFATSFGGGVLWMRVLPWGLFTAIEALYLIPVALLLRAVLRSGRPWAIVAGVPAVWALGEWLRAAGALGFPFGMLGYALHAETPVIQAASLGGVYLVSALAALASAGLYLTMTGGRPARRAASVAVAVPIVAGLWGMALLAADRDRPDIKSPVANVVVAQGNTHYQMDDPRGRAAFHHLAAATLAAARRAQTPMDLAVWSESSVPGLLFEETDLLGGASRVARELHAPLLTGTIGLLPDGRPANLAVLLGPDGQEAGTYQKRRLVPFGEWVPLRHVLPLLGDFGVVEQDEVPGSDWNVLESGRLKLGTPICFESAQPWIARAFVRNGANLLVIITNDAWFFHTGMAEQHANVAQLRAVETGRWVVRCGLTGISGTIDPRGVWRSRLPLDQAGALVADVRLRTGRTPFVRFGDWFLALCVLLALFALIRKPAERVP